MIDYEFFETPQAFTRYLFITMQSLQRSIAGNVYEPCLGNGGILEAHRTLAKVIRPPWTVDRWFTNDLDPRWRGDHCLDASTSEAWTVLQARGRVDWTVTNPPFTKALEIADQALIHSRVGVAMHLRASIHEVLKTGIRRTWMANNTPTGILWLPRFAYQRSKKTGEWKHDSVCAAWVIWLKDVDGYSSTAQFIRYAPAWVLDELEHETPIYRERMDTLLGFKGSEAQRREQRMAA